MTLAVIVVNLAMSLVYLAYGTMTFVDLTHGGWHDRTRRQFGLAFLAIMFTCGPHHLDHAIHLMTTDVQGQPLDLVVVALGLPAGVIWFALRVEALLGGPGDRYVHGTPRWMALLPVAGASYLAITMAATGRIARADDFDPIVLPNLVIMVLYLFVGSTLTATQFRNHAASGRWSTSGLALAGVFFTCALMHLVYAGYGITGEYQPDSHIFPIDLAGVPGGAYFLWLVVGVHRGQIGRRARSRAVAVPARPEAEVRTPEPVG